MVPTTANYLRFLAFLVSVSYAPMFLMPRLLWYLPILLVGYVELSISMKDMNTSLQMGGSASFNDLL
jgi:hypothetical protein